MDKEQADRVAFQNQATGQIMRFLWDWYRRQVVR